MELEMDIEDGQLVITLVDDQWFVVSRAAIDLDELRDALEQEAPDGDNQHNNC